MATEWIIEIEGGQFGGFLRKSITDKSIVINTNACIFAKFQENLQFGSYEEQSQNTVHLL